MLVRAATAARDPVVPFGGRRCAWQRVLGAGQRRVGDGSDDWRRRLAQIDLSLLPLFLFPPVGSFGLCGGRGWGLRVCARAPSICKFTRHLQYVMIVMKSWSLTYLCSWLVFCMCFYMISVITFRTHHTVLFVCFGVWDCWPHEVWQTMLVFVSDEHRSGDLSEQ